MDLIGRNVKIRNFKASDLTEFTELVKDKNNHKLAGLEYTEDDDYISDLLDLYIRRKEAHAIALLDDTFVGIIELNKRGESDDLILTREVGFVIDRKFRQKGYAKEAIQLLINYGFNELQLTEIWASTEEENRIPQKLLEILEFKYIYKVNQAFSYAEQSNVVNYYLLKK